MNPKLTARSLWKNRWSVESPHFLHITRQKWDKNACGFLLCIKLQVLILSSAEYRKKSVKELCSTVGLDLSVTFISDFNYNRSLGFWLHMLWISPVLPQQRYLILTMVKSLGSASVVVVFFFYFSNASLATNVFAILWS